MSLDGFIEANEMALSLADGNTLFIAGNGVVTGQNEVRAYISMVQTVKGRMTDMIADGLSLEQVIAANPTVEFDATWGDPGRFLPAAYRELSGN